MKHARRGQVLALASLSVLFMALTMAMSFSISSAIHERIRLQSQADAQAFSVATIEARGLNVMVYTNRTIAALVVTNMSVHAWHAIASQTENILASSQAGMLQVAAQEDACCERSGHGRRSPPEDRDACCNDADRAREISAAFGAEAQKWDTLLIGTEPAFNETVDGLNKAAAAMHVLQKRTLERVATEVSQPTVGTLKVLKERNAPRSEYVPALHAVNRTEFSCAVEGWKEPDDCRTLMGLTLPRLTPPKRSVIIEDVSNAARGSFQQYCAKGQCEAVGHPDFQPSSAYLLGIMGGEGSVCLGFDGKAGVTKLAHTLPPRNTFEAESVGAETAGGLMVGWRHGKGSGSLVSNAFSDEAGGVHGPGHSGRHDQFRGIQRQEVCQRTESCFINFRGLDPSTRGRTKGGDEVALSLKDNDLGLPSAWGVVKQDLGLLRSGKKGPWQLNDEGTVTLKWGPHVKATAHLAPGEGVAVAKAKVYFHELGSDRVPVPNLFDPFFRAKLERFRCLELVEVLMLAGDVEGATLVRELRAPVEGQRQMSGCTAEEAE